MHVYMHAVSSVLSDSLQPYEHSSPGSSVHGIFQVRILEWVAMPSSRGSSRPRDPDPDGFFITSATWGSPGMSLFGLKRKYECILKEDRAAYLEYLVGEEEW